MNRLFPLIFLLAAGLLGVPAHAARLPLDPQNRAHLGLSLVDGTAAYGLSGGLDSRLTRFVYVDVGGFLSPFGELAAQPTGLDTRTGDWVKMRHALWAAPGMRIPHRYGDGITWDVFVRAGFGVVWSQDLSADYDWLANPAGLGGLDLMLRKDQLGLRISGKGFAYRAFPTVAWRESWASDELGVLSTQIAVEGVYQW